MDLVTSVSHIGCLWEKQIVYFLIKEIVALDGKSHTEIYYCMELSHFCEMQLMLEACKNNIN
jgi:hypothetical protein